MIYEVLTFSSIWLWILIIATFSWIVFHLEDDNASSSTWGFLVAMGVYWAFGERTVVLSLVEAVKQNPQIIFFIVLGYLLLGSIWAVFKWYLRIVAFKQDLNGAKIAEIPTKMKASWNKGTIIAWMSWWPFSIFWFILNDPLRRLFQWAYSRIGGTLDKITSSVLKDSIMEKDDKK